MTEYTEATIGETWHHGTPCTNCGTSYRDCTVNLFRQRGGKACCSTCGYTGTHDERDGKVPTAAMEERKLWNDLAYDVKHFEGGMISKTADYLRDHPAMRELMRRERRG